MRIDSIENTLVCATCGAIVEDILMKTVSEPPTLITW